MRRPSLTQEQVHEIRTAGLPDAHWERVLGVTRTCVQKARVGVTWITHATPPDTEPRMRSQGNGGRTETHNLPQMSVADRAVSRLLAKWPASKRERHDVTGAAECSTLETGPLEPENIT